ncbi:glycosyltransferase family 4 protein [Synechocystis sp. PCC 7509]|uniref:glycosyltransferase family 4 protein n=1 Tax=Synechocystis sp. PCC 7509 TaxID=927677 RepID=UPI0002ABF0B3|nr:glycosyltransferase family 1 protein [Synechocystis sp. PCC 7509]
MNLNGINVLIDCYNLELIQGTGIKTYGISLIKALNLLEANVNLLCSRSSGSPKSILNEVLFFDRQHTRATKLNQIKSLLSTVTQFYPKVKNLNNSNFIIKQESDLFFDLVNSENIFTAHNCYDIANFLYKNFRITNKVRFAKKIDIWHSTCPMPLEVDKAKKITTIHDLIPLKLPYTTLDDKNFFFKLIKKSIEKSHLILAVSEHTKKDIIDIFNVSSDKIFVTYQPVIQPQYTFNENELLILLKQYRLRVKEYILFVGAIEPKKNLGRLIEAYIKLDTSMPLVIVGKKGWLWEDEIGKLQKVFPKYFIKKIKFLEYISRSDLTYLYQGACCFVFPSLYEGFGLPPLEAMALGCPTIVSNVSSLPEVCGDAALYVDPYDVVNIRDQIETLITDPFLQTQLSLAGKERAKLFSFNNYTNKLYEAYKKVI